MNLKTRQIDFDNAFVQSELSEKEQVFVKMPPMSRSRHGIKNIALKLLKGLHGMRESPRLWFTTVCAGLLEMEFEQSKHDPCMFLHREKEVVLLLCTDDVLLFSKSNAALDEVLTETMDKFKLTEEDQGKDAFLV